MDMVGIEAFALRLGQWVLGGGALYALLRYLLPKLAERTTIQLDDIILGVTWRPFLIVFAVLGLDHSLELLPLYQDHGAKIDTAAWFIAASTVAWWLWRLLQQVVVAYGEQHAMETESRVDDILIPLTKRATPIFIAIALSFILVWISFGADGITTYLTVLGGLSFLLVFLFQEPLSNLFGGIYLLLDAPFRYGDLIILEDGKTYRVDRIGTRVTQMYDIAEHTIAYLPNNQLASQRIVNITRPTVELRLGLDVGVAYGSDLRLVVNVLEEVANAEPNVLGVLADKERAIAARLEREPEPVARDLIRLELERLRAEQPMREQTETLSRLLQDLAHDAAAMKCQGLDAGEREILGAKLDLVESVLDELRALITRWQFLNVHVQVVRENLAVTGGSSVGSRIQSIIEHARSLQVVDDAERIRAADLDDHEVALIAALGNADDEFLNGGPFRSLAQAIDDPPDGCADADEIQRAMAARIAEIATTTALKDIKDQYGDWHRIVGHVTGEIKACRKVIDDPSSYHALLLDTKLDELWQWCTDRFLLTVPSQQLPGADLVAFGASSIDFRLEFFVDDIQGEHFERRGRIETDIRLAIARRFDEEGIEMPFPQLDLYVKQGPVQA